MGVTRIELAPIFTSLSSSCGYNSGPRSQSGGYAQASRPARESRVRPIPALLFQSSTPRTLWRERQENGTWTWYYTQYGCKYTAVDLLSTHAGYTAYDYALAGECAPTKNSIESILRQNLRRSAVNLAQALGEYRQTASLFSELAGDVLKAWRGFRRGWLTKYNGVWRPKAGYTKAFANRWLQYQYGVMPLIGDVQGSLKALQGAASRPMYYKFAVKQRTQAIRLSSGKSFVVSPPGAGTWVREITVRRRYTHRCIATLKNQELSASLGSTGFTNPVSLAWELLPYSFVIDWFIDVGDFLASLDDDLYFNDARYISSYQEQFDDKISGGGSSSTYTRVTTCRNPIASLGSPKMTWEPSMSYKRIISAVALLRQNL